MIIIIIIIIIIIDKEKRELIQEAVDEKQLFGKSVVDSSNIGSVERVLTAAACENIDCQKAETVRANEDVCNGAILSTDNFGCDATGNRSKSSILEGHSHSVVPGGLEVRSYITREMPGTVKIPSTIFWMT